MLELQEMILADSKIDMSAIDNESIRVIALHAKYLGLWEEAKTSLSKFDEAYKITKREKTDYYLGRSNDEVYEKSPFNLKIPRQDLDIYLDADDDLCRIRRNLLNAQNKVDVIKYFIDNNLNQRSHHFRNVLQFLQWSSGK